MRRLLFALVSFLALAASSEAAAPEKQRNDQKVERKQDFPSDIDVDPSKPVDATEPAKPDDPEEARREEMRRSLLQDGTRRRGDEYRMKDIPDVLLDAGLSVDEIRLIIEGVRAHLSLDAKAAQLVQIKAGVDLEVDRIKLVIKKVAVDALLKVRLDNVTAIVDRVMTTLDRNPWILKSLLRTLEQTVGQTLETVEGVAKTVVKPVLQETVNTLGQTVVRTVNSVGQIVQETLTSSGKPIDKKVVGTVRKLPVVEEEKKDNGQVVKTVRDSSGGLIRYTLDQDGEIIDITVVSKGEESGGSAENEGKN